MKKVLKIIAVVLAIVVVFGAVITAPYGISFLSSQNDIDFNMDLSFGENMIFDGENYKKASVSTDENGVTKIVPEKKSVEWFNYYGVSYKSKDYVKGTVCYNAGLKEKSENFFLEPAEKGEFFSFIDNCLEGTKANRINYITLEPVNNKKSGITVKGIALFNREIPENEIFVEKDNLKVGIDLGWGGALSYVEDTNSSVEAVSVDGKIKVDSNAGKRYNAEVVNSNVNLINRNDTGRLVQQSYYGTLDYDFGVYMENDWRYNPVQGGNQYNDPSKIVDLRVSENSIYIKCRPLDWAKEKEYITPSYMEATYSIEDGLVHASCRFVDFSGYPEAESSQEIPAFYCIEPLNNFVYYKGDKPWTGGELTYEKNLIFWPDAGYPHFYSKENWAAFTGEFDDSFGIGLYVPGEEEFLTGVYMRGETTNEDPSRDGPTSYIAVTKTRTFKSFEPYEYEYYLATGDTTEIREAFSKIEK
ncbi:MAG: hypothetical protein E7533_05065 [Ruminococcaceae bacterium]|nr:hypothetical protein [Oscillospiraceae bacterium]